MTVKDRAIQVLEAALGEKGVAHSKRVAAVFTGHLEIVALLHDVVEDSDVTVEEITVEFGEAVGAAVDALTRKPFPVETYAAYIDRLAQTPAAVKVKLADIHDHLYGELAAPKETLLARYKKAQKVLLAIEKA